MADRAIEPDDSAVRFHSRMLFGEALVMTFYVALIPMLDPAVVRACALVMMRDAVSAIAADRHLALDVLARVVGNMDAGAV